MGKRYPLDFFHAERHLVQSNMLITTTLDLSNNGDMPIDGDEHLQRWRDRLMPVVDFTTSTTPPAGARDLM
jgi:hypothetical protein